MGSELEGFEAGGGAVTHASPVSTPWVRWSTALVETGEGAYGAELLDEPVRGRGFGLFGMVDGVGDLVSSVVVGVLFTVTNPAWGFIYAAALSTGAVVLMAERTGRVDAASR
jgi:hypothetical protein